MKLVIEMNMDNAEFHGVDGESETADGMTVAEHLKVLAERLHDYALNSGDGGPVKAFNGSRIGTWSVQD